MTDSLHHLSATVPCGMAEHTLPVGLQIVGPKYGDALVLRSERASQSVRGTRPYRAPTMERR